MKCNKSGANYHGQNSKMCPESYYSKSYFSRTNMCSVYTAVEKSVEKRLKSIRTPHFCEALN